MCVGAGEAFLGDVRSGRAEEPRGADSAAPRRHRVRSAAAAGGAVPVERCSAAAPAVPGGAGRVLEQAVAAGQAAGAPVPGGAHPARPALGRGVGAAALLPQLPAHRRPRGAPAARPQALRPPQPYVPHPRTRTLSHTLTHTPTPLLTCTYTFSHRTVVTLYNKSSPVLTKLIKQSICNSDCTCPSAIC